MEDEVFLKLIQNISILNHFADCILH